MIAESNLCMIERSKIGKQSEAAIGSNCSGVVGGGGESAAETPEPQSKSVENNT